MQRFLLPTLLAFLPFVTQANDNFDILKNARKIVFLGDSITYGGEYVVFFERWLTVNHPERGRGIVVEVMPDMRRVVRFDKGGETHRYSPHALYKLMEDRRKTGGPACSGNYDRQAASRMPTEPEHQHTLQIIRAGEAAALAVLERDAAHKAQRGVHLTRI